MPQLQSNPSSSLQTSNNNDTLFTAKESLGAPTSKDNNAAAATNGQQMASTYTKTAPKFINTGKKQLPKGSS